MKCPNCGAYIDTSLKACQYCGTPNDYYIAEKAETCSPHQPAQDMEKIARDVYNQERAKEEPAKNDTMYHSAADKTVVHHTVVTHQYVNVPAKSSKSRWLLLLLFFFMGGLGIHKFYQGKIGMGILYLLTFGICGIGLFCDFFSIIFGHPKDKNGLPICW